MKDGIVDQNAPEFSNLTHMLVKTSLVFLHMMAVAWEIEIQLVFSQIFQLRNSLSLPVVLFK